jgi:hypothetical protein
MCKHLERELRRVERTRRSVAACPMPSLDRFLTPEEKPKELLRREMYFQLRGYALPDICCWILVYKFVDNMGYQEIAEELGLKWAQSAQKLYTRSIKYLQDRGFERGKDDE